MVSGPDAGGDRDLNLEVFVMRQLTRISERGGLRYDSKGLFPERYCFIPDSAEEIPGER